MKTQCNLQVSEGDDNIPHPSKDLMFDPWVTIAGPELKEITASIIDDVLEALTHAGRPPRKDLVLNVTDIVPVILANLIVLLKDRPPGSRLVMPMAKLKTTRYDRKRFHKLPTVVKVMADAKYVIKHDAVFRRKRAAIEPWGKLKTAILQPKISLSNTARVHGEETIQLHTRPDKRWQYGRKQPNEPVDYVDIPATYEMRKEMSEINSFLRNFSIKLEGQPCAPIQLVRRFLIRNSKDPTSFNLHGRLYGGFWMNLKSTERQHIRVDDEPIADLDFDSMFPRLAYHHVGKEPPQGDLYAVPGLEAHRDGAKAGLSALLSQSSGMKRLPSSVKALLPHDWTASTLKEAMTLHHPHLVPLFGTDFGLDLMFTESRILLAALRGLMRQGILALPMHDGLMVSVSKSDEAREAMTKSAIEIVGHELPVSLKV